jgi:hypothetical protein
MHVKATVRFEKSEGLLHLQIFSFWTFPLIYQDWSKPHAIAVDVDRFIGGFAE